MVERMLPYWYDAIVPDLRTGRDRLRRRARQLAACAGQAPRRHLARRPSSGSTSRPASRWSTARRAPAADRTGGEYLDPDAAADAIKAVANQGR